MIHLIYAEDELLAQEMVAQLQAKLRVDSEVIAVSAEASEVPGLEEAIVSRSLFAESRFVVVHDAERLQSGGARRLAEVLGGAPPGVEVAVVAISERPPTTLQKALQGIAKPVSIRRPKRGELTAWVAKRIKDAGATAGRDVAAMLIEAIGGHLRELAQAAEQLALRVGPGNPVEREDVMAHFPGLAEQPVWSLYDALVAGDGRRAFRVLHSLLEQGEDAMAILFAVVGQNRLVMRAKSITERTPSIPDPSLAQAIGCSPGRAAVVRRQASHLQWDWLVRLHHACAQADFELKGGDEVRIVGLLPPEMILERVVRGMLPAADLVPG